MNQWEVLKIANPMQPIRTSISSRWQQFWGPQSNRITTSPSLKSRKPRATRWCRAWPSSRIPRIWIQQICSISRSSCGAAARTMNVLQTHIMRDASTTAIWSNLIQRPSRAKNELQSWMLEGFNIVNSFQKYLARTRKSWKSTAQPCIAWLQNLERKNTIPSKRKFQIWSTAC